MDGFLLLRNIQVENANCIAGQTWGFPAISHFLGFTHALQRKLQQDAKPDFHLGLRGCAVICHQLEPQTYKATTYAEHVFSLTRNPLTKDAKTASFVEEGRVNMKVSLLIGIDAFNFGDDGTAEFEQKIYQLVQTMRLAGGTINQIRKARLVTLKDSQEEQAKQVNIWMRTLLPGHTLVARPQLLSNHGAQFSESENSELSAWLDNSTIHINRQEGANSVEPKLYSGWIKPIVVGYRGISQLYKAGEVAKSRDAQTPVRFVEYAYSLGEWLSPHRIQKLEQILWQYSDDKAQAEQGWYLCHNQYENFLTNTTDNEGI